MSLYEASVPQMKKMLNSVSGFLEKAAALAKEKAFEPSVLLGARLAPDQYSLMRQVQAACDAAKFGVARLTGKEPPKHPDTETTLEELQARIKSVVAYLDTYKVEDFKDAETRAVLLPWLEGKIVFGEDYLNEMALPNFYFHVTTAYAILRHNGVSVGKRDFIGSMKTHDKQ